MGLSWKMTKPPVRPSGMSSRLKAYGQYVLEKQKNDKMIYLSLTSTRLVMRPLEMVSWTLEFLKTK